MFRTARVPTLLSLPAWKVVILAFLVSCLAMHFLVEDLIFLSDQPSIAPITENINELTHQDDLVSAVNLPDRVSTSQPWLDFQTILPSQSTVFFPILQPPKI